MSIAALTKLLADGTIGTVVATLGTTSLGAVDDLPAILALSMSAGVRVHVDSAYGGFFRLLADGNKLDPYVSASYLAMGEADSIVIDPHKHGLQPYGCGSVLFRDAADGRFYKHDSPYTYFSSDELHLGEISLECSRAGAAAAAFWATLQAFPLQADGLGRVLAKTREAALTLAGLIAGSADLALVTPPDLDIVCFYPHGTNPTPVSAVSSWSDRIFADGMRTDPSAFYLAKLTMTPEQLPSERHPGLVWDAPSVTVLRSVLMKPEHAALAPELFRRIEKSVQTTR
jgi:glutamate/tyrosine decarboxylase-like PLP-dependent enzyme